MFLSELPYLLFFNKLLSHADFFDVVILCSDDQLRRGLQLATAIHLCHRCLHDTKIVHTVETKLCLCCMFLYAMHICHICLFFLYFQISTYHFLLLNKATLTVNIIISPLFMSIACSQSYYTLRISTCLTTVCQC